MKSLSALFKRTSRTEKSDLEKYLETKNIKTQEELEFYLKRYDEDRYTSSKMLGLGDYIGYNWFKMERNM